MHNKHHNSLPMAVPSIADNVASTDIIGSSIAEFIKNTTQIVALPLASVVV